MNKCTKESIMNHEQECPIIKTTKIIAYTIGAGAIILLGMIMYHGVYLGGFTNNMSF